MCAALWNVWTTMNLGARAAAERNYAMVRAMVVALASLLCSASAFSAAPRVPSTRTRARAVINVMAMGSLEISKPDEKEISGQAMRDWLPKT